MLNILLSIPKTIYFNFSHLPVRQAFRLPVWIHFRCKLKIQGTVICRSNETASVRLGFHTVYNVEENKSVLIVQKGATIEFKGHSHIGKGSKIIVYGGATLQLGGNFSISAASSIKCYKEICIGENVLVGWNNLILDSDAHSIYNSESNLINPDKPIKIGDKVWIGCNSLILKGTEIPSNCVIGAGAVVSGHSYSSNTIIAGNPAVSVKSIGWWKE